MDWSKNWVAVFRAKNKNLRAVEKDEIDFVDINALIGLKFQKQELLKNTENFILGNGANHALLWGERGCGKSSLAKAVFTKFFSQNLRVIEIGKDDLENLVDILDEIRREPFYFIIFCDDLSFEQGDDSYKHLKPLLDGSMQKAPKNVLMYATSNRRHIVSEYMKDNQNIEVTNDEIHYKDAVEERISLSDRFGLQLSFYQGNFEEYLRIVDNYFSNYLNYNDVKNSDENERENFEKRRENLHNEAKKYAMLRASRSGRTAKQFYLAYKEIFY